MRAPSCALAAVVALAHASAAWAQPPSEEPDEPSSPPAEPPALPAPLEPAPVDPGPVEPPLAPPPAAPPAPQAPPVAPQPYPSPYYGPPPPGAYPQGQPYWGPPPPPGPPPLEPEEPSCCRVGIRFDPFDLLFRRLSFQAEVKLWVTAAAGVRAHRRWLELKDRRPDLAEATILAELNERDGRDAPNMTRAPDAHLLDTSEMSIEQAFRAALFLIEAARKQ